MFKKLVSFVAAAILAFTPVLAAPSPTTSNNGGGYTGQSFGNAVVANGEIAYDIGGGLTIGQSGNIYNAQGTVIGNANNGVWAIASQASFHFTTGANDATAFEHFIGLNVDGDWVHPSFYNASRGSVVIDLKQAFINRLKAGNHTITVMFDDRNEVSAAFTVTRTNGAAGTTAAGVPNTGEQSKTAYYVMLAGAVIAVAGAGYVLATSKK